MRKEEISDHLGKLAFCFFYKYSRFEFALKNNGYLKDSKPDRPTKPDWYKFVDAWCREYSISAEAKELIEAPPKRQVVAANNCWKWEVVELNQCLA